MLSRSQKASILFVGYLRVASRNRHSKPDKRQQRIGQPVQPTQTSNIRPVFMMQIHPDVEKFVDAQTGNVIRFEPVGSQVFFSDIEVAFEWRYTPAKRSIGDHRTARAEFYAYVRFHIVQGPATASAYYTEPAISNYQAMIRNSFDNPQEH
jgi:hypothetical protein